MSLTYYHGYMICVCVCVCFMPLTFHYRRSYKKNAWRQKLMLVNSRRVPQGRPWKSSLKRYRSTGNFENLSTCMPLITALTMSINTLISMDWNTLPTAQKKSNACNTLEYLCTSDSTLKIPSPKFQCVTHISRAGC